TSSKRCAAIAVSIRTSANHAILLDHLAADEACLSILMARVANMIRLPERYPGTTSRFCCCRHWWTQHFQQKCVAVLRQEMRQRNKHFQQKCAAVLRPEMRKRNKHFQQKCVAVLRPEMARFEDSSS